MIDNIFCDSLKIYIYLENYIFILLIKYSTWSDICNDLFFVYWFDTAIEYSTYMITDWYTTCVRLLITSNLIIYYA